MKWYFSLQISGKKIRTVINAYMHADVSLKWELGYFHVTEWLKLWIGAY